MYILKCKIWNKIWNISKKKMSSTSALLISALVLLHYTDSDLLLIPIPFHYGTGNQRAESISGTRVMIYASDTRVLINVSESHYSNRN